MGISNHLTCLLRNPYAGQEATVRIGHGTTDWFQIGKRVSQGCILSPCLFNFYSEYIMIHGVAKSRTRLSNWSDLICCPMSNSNCCFLTCIQISQETGKVIWYSHLVKNFPQFVMISTVKGFDIVNKAEVDGFSGTFLELFQWSSGCWQLDLWFLCLF